MYHPGTIIFFTPFVFKNGDTRDKYFIVLHNEDGHTIYASLPTSKDHIPSSVKIKHGCIDLPDVNINCYRFEANQEITEDGGSFPKPTFLHGSQLDDYPANLLRTKYTIEKDDYEVMGKLTNDEYLNIIRCFSGSNSVKSKYRKIFTKILSN